MERKMEQQSVNIDKTKKRSATVKPCHMQPCFATGRAQPSLTSTTTVENSQERQLHQGNFLWIFSRMKLNSNGEVIPGWKGWLSSTTSSPQNVNEISMCSIVEYMPVINAPITESATVQKVLQISLEATQDLGQPYTFVTFDLAVAKKAYDIVWQNPQHYKTVIIHLGVFHTIKCRILVPWVSSKVDLALKKL